MTDGALAESGQSTKYVPPHKRISAAGGTGNVVEADEASTTATGKSEPPLPARTGGPSWKRRTAPVVDSGPRGNAPATSTGGNTWAERDGRNRVPDPDPSRIFHDQMQTGIKFDDYDKIPVDVSGPGSETIVPVNKFREAKLHYQLIENIERCRYLRPTPVQKFGIPIALARRDLMACAQTGSGKTAAFLLPTLELLLQEGPPVLTHAPDSRRRKRAYPAALILAPTRELVSQIYEECCKFCYGSGMRAVVIYGGVEAREQIAEIDRGCDVLVATPGRLIDLIERGIVSLKYVTHLIFDEADRMLDMGFEPQIRTIVSGHDMPAKGQRLTTMFSATFPAEIQQLAADFLNQYVFLAIGRVGSTHESISQTLQYVEDRDKIRSLRLLLDESKAAFAAASGSAGGASSTTLGLTLVFVETKRKADELEHYLWDEGYPATSIHGDRSQSDREMALKQFKTGRIPILIATDIAARGLDIPNVNHVINFDLPNNIDDYVHRIGRTGRAGNVGKATSFVNEGSRSMLGDIREILQESKQPVPAWLSSMLAPGAGGGAFGGSRGGSAGHRDQRGRRFHTDGRSGTVNRERWHDGGHERGAVRSSSDEASQGASHQSGNPSGDHSGHGHQSGGHAHHSGHSGHHQNSGGSNHGQAGHGFARHHGGGAGGITKPGDRPRPPRSDRPQ